MKRYEFVEHTADAAVWVYGASLKELFVSAAMAMFAFLVAKRKNKPKVALKEVSFEKEGGSLEDLLKAWLDELLFYYSTEGLILHRVKSLACSRDRFKTKILLDIFDEEYYEPKGEIKAVTYHELKVEQVRGRWRAHIIFDV